METHVLWHGIYSSALASNCSLRLIWRSSFRCLLDLIIVRILSGPAFCGGSFFPQSKKHSSSHVVPSAIASEMNGHVTYRKTSDRSPRLLSVQVSQTPGLYAGPGVYPGPGFCHNMSSLCYFIQKNRQISYCRISVFCLFSH